MTRFQTMKHAALFFILTLVLGLFSPSISPAADTRVYELRTYVANPGRFEALLTRFREHTCKLFEKHGIVNIGYWVQIKAADGDETTLIYIVAHPSREAAKTNWKSFGADPEWQTARKASEEAGKILAKAPESVFMNATDYSPAIISGSADKERVFELRTYTTQEGKFEALQTRFKDHTMGLFTKHGMTHIGYWVPNDLNKGAGNKLIYILAHQDQDSGLAAFTAFRADPAWVKAKAESEINGALTVLQPDGVKSVYLRALSFSPIR